MVVWWLGRLINYRNVYMKTDNSINESVSFKKQKLYNSYLFLKKIIERHPILVLALWFQLIYYSSTLLNGKFNHKYNNLIEIKIYIEGGREKHFSFETYKNGSDIHLSESGVLFIDDYVLHRNVEMFDIVKVESIK